MKILVSRCLLGEPCRYDGRSVPTPAVEQLRQAGHTLISICPEVMGGLSTPRPPAECQPDGRIVNRLGEDVTAAYEAGAALALETARQEGCTLALLKEKSPSCGCHMIYDGMFSGRLIPGMGMAAQRLREAGIPVYSELDLPDGLPVGL